MTAIGSLVEAWSARYTKASKTLAQAEKAPALFKPAYVAELVAERDRAAAWMQYFGVQS